MLTGKITKRIKDERFHLGNDQSGKGRRAIAKEETIEGEDLASLSNLKQLYPGREKTGSETLVEYHL